MDEDPEVYCDKCGWGGLTKDLDGLKCPACKDALHINDCDPEYEYDNMILGGGKFNWNKK